MKIVEARTSCNMCGAMGRGLKFSHIKNGKLTILIDCFSSLSQIVWSIHNTN